MIQIQLFKDNISNWGEPFEARINETGIEYGDRLDEGLNTLSFQTTSTLLADYVLPIKKYTKVKVVFDDGTTYFGIVDKAVDKLASFGETEQELVVDIDTTELVAMTKGIIMQTVNMSNEVSNDGSILTWTIGERVERLNKLIWTKDLRDERQVPFELTFDQNDWWVGITSPEMFYDSQNLFEILVAIGEVVGGRPKLDYVSNGVYKLGYRQWNNKNTTHHTDTNFTQRVRTSTSEGYANFLESDAKNMISSSIDGDAQMMIPSYDGFIATNSPQDYVYVIERDSERVVRLPFGVAKILNVTVNITGLSYDTPDTVVDITDMVVPYDTWRTYVSLERTESWFSKQNAKCNYLYFKYNEPYLYNFEDAKMEIQSRVAQYSPLDNYPAGRILVRIKYIPYINARIKVSNNEGEKPVGSYVNQGDQVISSQAFADYMDGLVKRMQGEYTVYSFAKPRNTVLYAAGEWLNDELIVEVNHTVTTESIVSTYTCVPEFNRRSEYKGYPHQLRTWAIPENNNDRTILYAENIECSIGTTLEVSNGNLTSAGQQLLGNYTGANRKKPCLSYMAWKDDEEVLADVNKQNNGYGLQSILAIPFGKSLVWMWGCEDNAGIGERGYGVNNTIYSQESRRQKFILYPKDARYLQYKISSQAPTSFVFDGSEEYTDTNQENANNQNLHFTYPMSNNKQYVDCVSLGEYKFEIQKDLRDRIISSTQLDFIGKHGTIVYNDAVKYSPLCNDTQIGLKVYQGGEQYATYTQAPHGTAITVSSVSVAQQSGQCVITLTLASQVSANVPIAITTDDDELMFATNTGVGEATSSLKIYLSNRKKQYSVL